MLRTRGRPGGRRRAAPRGEGVPEHVGGTPTRCLQSRFRRTEIELTAGESIDSRRNPRAVGPATGAHTGPASRAGDRRGITGREIDRAVRQQLRTLSKENADGVAQHLVMITIRLPKRTFRRRGRMLRRRFAVPGGFQRSREAMGMVHCRSGDWALRCRSSGQPGAWSGSHLLPLAVDCEQGMGPAGSGAGTCRGSGARRLTNAERSSWPSCVSGSDVTRQLDARCASAHDPSSPGSVKARMASSGRTTPGAMPCSGAGTALRARGGSIAAPWSSARTPTTIDAGEQVERTRCREVSVRGPDGTPKAWGGSGRGGPGSALRPRTWCRGPDTAVPDRTLGLESADNEKDSSDADRAGIRAGWNAIRALRGRPDWRVVWDA